MNHLDKKISIYENAFDSVGREVSLLEWLTVPDPAQVDRMERIRSMTSKEDQSKAKQSIQCATISGTFKRNQRNEQGLIRHSGLIAVDIDQEANESIDFSQLREQVTKIPCCAYAGYSVRGRGLWLIIPVKYPQQHHEHFNALENDFRSQGIRIDTQCKNISRLRYYSYDAQAYFNPDAQPYAKLHTPDTGLQPPRFRQPSGRHQEDVFNWAKRRVESKGFVFEDGDKHSFLYRFCCLLIIAGVHRVEAERWIDANLIPLQQVKSNCIDYAYKKWRHDFGRMQPAPPERKPDRPMQHNRKASHADEQFTAMCRTNPALLQFVECLSLVNPSTGLPYVQTS